MYEYMVRSHLSTKVKIYLFPLPESFKALLFIEKHTKHTVCWVDRIKKFQKNQLEGQKVILVFLKSVWFNFENGRFDFKRVQSNDKLAVFIFICKLLISLCLVRLVFLFVTDLPLIEIQ